MIIVDEPPYVVYWWGGHLNAKTRVVFVKYLPDIPKIVYTNATRACNFIVNSESVLKLPRWNFNEFWGKKVII